MCKDLLHLVSAVCELTSVSDTQALFREHNILTLWVALVEGQACQIQLETGYQEK